MKKIYYTILFFLCFIGIAQAQNFTGGAFDFSNNHASGIFTDTSKFTYGILSASDYTVQRSLQTLDQRLGASGASIIINCDKDVDAFCFVYDTGSEQLALWVNQTQQAVWPALSTAIDVLLLETGDKLLLENGADAILLE